MTSTTKKKPDRKSSSSNVCKNVTRILETIVIVIKISNARLIRLLLSPIWIMLNIFLSPYESISQRNSDIFGVRRILPVMDGPLSSGYPPPDSAPCRRGFRQRSPPSHADDRSSPYRPRLRSHRQESSRWHPPPSGFRPFR